MPRGRAGLDLIAPARVVETFKRVYSWRNGPTEIARAWFVNERTVRRWQKTGLPLCYGKVWITRDEWQAFEKTGAVPKSRTPSIAAPAKSEKVSVRSTSTRSRRNTCRSTGVRAIARTGVRP